MELIRSRDNPRIKQLAALLSQKKERDRTGLFALEGARLCGDAMDSGVRIRTLLLTERAAEKYPAARKLAASADEVLWLEPSLSARLGETQSPQGIFAVGEKLDNGKSAVKIRDGGYYILLKSLQDPGNLGSILRTAEAVGVDGVYLSADCPDLYSPKVLRGSMGGVFRLSVTIADNLLPEIAQLKSSGLPVYAAALTGDAAPVNQVDFSTGGAVVIGNEGNGLPTEVIEACTAGIIIPMAGRADSLGAAAAAAILIWEMRRDRAERIPKDGEISGN